MGDSSRGCSCLTHRLDWSAWQFRLRSIRRSRQHGGGFLPKAQSLRVTVEYCSFVINESFSTHTVQCWTETRSSKSLVPILGVSLGHSFRYHLFTNTAPLHRYENQTEIGICRREIRDPEVRSASSSYPLVGSTKVRKCRGWPKIGTEQGGSRSLAGPLGPVLGRLITVC